MLKELVFKENTEYGGLTLPDHLQTNDRSNNSDHQMPKKNDDAKEREQKSNVTETFLQSDKENQLRECKVSFHQLLTTRQGNCKVFCDVVFTFVLHVSCRQSSFPRLQQQPTSEVKRRRNKNVGNNKTSEAKPNPSPLKKKSLRNGYTPPHQSPSSEDLVCRCVFAVESSEMERFPPFVIKNSTRTKSLTPGLSLLSTCAVPCALCQYLF